MVGHAKIIKYTLLALVTLGAAVPNPGLEKQDTVIVVKEGLTITAEHSTAGGCTDSACNVACYQRGGYTGGSCIDEGECKCATPESFRAFDQHSMKDPMHTARSCTRYTALNAFFTSAVACEIHRRKGLANVARAAVRTSAIRMEHLLFTGVPAPIIIPYHGTEDWDGGDFLTYPQRKGWNVTRWEPSKSGDDLDTGGPSFQEMSAFLQVWLFFGLLESVLEIKLPRKDFTHLGKNGKGEVITTTKLKAYLEDWGHRIRDLSEVEKEQKATIIWRFMAEAIAVNRHLSFHFFYGEHRPEYEPLLESLFCQTLLDNALQRALCEILPDTQWALLAPGSNMQLLLWERMLVAGWCPYTLAFLDDQLQADALAFTFSLGTVRAQQDHGPCKAASLQQASHHCIAAGMNTKAILKYKHVTAGCECQPIGPSMQEVIELIEDGWTPIVSIATSDDTDSIEILTDGIKLDAQTGIGGYLALSHVHADGLGNSEHNTLPTCQVRWLFNLLQTLDEDTYLTEGAKPVAQTTLHKGRVTLDFWLDTFCIPVQPQFQELRDRCIRQMHEVYLKAAGVLVLDPDLQRIGHASRPIEIIARLLCSLWRTRLWTYQEGSLAFDLYVPCQSGTVKLSNLYDSIPDFSDSDSEKEETAEIPDHDIIEYQVAKSLIAACTQSIWRPGGRPDIERDPQSTLERMLHATAHRSTSRQDDETICIATFIGIDPTPLLETSPPHRMTTLLTHLHLIPPSILFSRGPRLKSSGFHWAPRTFLAPYGFRDKLVFPLTCIPDAADPMTRIAIPPPFLHPLGLGLTVFLPGITFASRPGVPTPENFAITTSDGTRYLITFHDSGLERSWTEMNPSTFRGSAAIVLVHPTLKSCEHGLLVELLGRETEEGYACCRWRCLVTVSFLDDVELGDKRTEMVGKCRVAGEYVPYRWWVID